MKMIAKSIQAAGLLMVFIVTACSGAAPQAYEVATALPEATAGDFFLLDGVPVTEAVVDACELIVTKSDAMGVMTGPIADGISGYPPPSYSCIYTNEAYDELKVYITPYASEADAEASFLATYDYGGYSMVSGVGDQAYEAAPVFDLYVLFGLYEISVDITDGNSADLQLQYAIEIAEVVISRLP